MSRALTQKRAAHSRWICLLEDGCEREAPLSPIALSRDCKGGQVGEEREACQWALTQKRTLGSWFETWAAYLRDCSVELPLRPSAIAAPPSGPSLLYSRLRGVGFEGEW